MLRMIKILIIYNFINCNFIGCANIVLYIIYNYFISYFI